MLCCITCDDCYYITYSVSAGASGRVARLGGLRQGVAREADAARDEPGGHRRRPPQGQLVPRQQPAQDHPPGARF